MNKTNPKTNEKEYLSREEELRYIEIAKGKTNASVQEIKEAKGILFANIKDFIQPRAADHAWKFTNNVVDEDDFMSDAYLGFEKALENFDPAQGNKLLTYAISAIDQEMHRDSMRTAYSVSVSSGDCSKYCKGLKLQAQGLNDDEISEKTGIKWGKCKNMGFYRSLQDPLYVSDDGGIIEVGDTIADQSVETAEEIGDRIDNEATLAGLKNILDQLPEEKRLPIMARCGFNGRVYTFDELRVFYGVKTASAAKKRYERDCADVLKAFSYMNLPLAG